MWRSLMALMAKSILRLFFWQRTLFVDPLFCTHACPNACTISVHLAYLMEGFTHLVL